MSIVIRNIKTTKFKYIFKDKDYDDYFFKVFTLKEIEDGKPKKVLDESIYFEIHNRLQWSGLKDMHGIEIYEEDILRADDDEYIIGIVRFVDGSFVVHYENIEEPLSNFKGSYVFGNPYNDPELLKEIEKRNNDIYPYRGL